MATKILCVCDAAGGQIRPTAFEITTAARRLAGEAGGGEVHALVIGAGVAGSALELGAYGADTVHVVEDERLDSYAPAAFAAAVSAAVDSIGPRLVLLAVSPDNRDLGARMAARLGTSALADVVELSMEGGRPIALRPIYAGKVNLRVTTADEPAIATLRPRMFEAQRSGEPAAAVETLAVELGDDLFVGEIVERQAAEKKKVNLAEADVIVSGGRGLKGPEHFHLVEELADALGAAVGASRAVVDAGWRSHEEQVGQTGKTVTPTLYVALGISGAIQHLAGMARSKVIVAVNKDADAPIFGVADYGIVGDVFEVAPPLTEAIRKTRG